MTTLVDLGSLDRRLTGLQRPNGTTLTSGLSRAVAARVGIDALLIRLALIGLVFAGGLGLVVYVWGTLLTPREGGVAPIRRFVPAFERWSRSTQLLVILGTGLAVVVSSAAQGNFSVVPALVVIGVVVLMRRSSARSQPRPGTPGQARAPGQAWAPPVPGATSPAPVPATQTESISQWRARLAEYASVRTGPSDPLPVVDLYGPEPDEQPQPRTARPQVPVSWLGTLLVVLLSGGAAAGAFMFGLTPTWLWAAVLGTGVAGVTMFFWALLVRSRRLPVIVLVLALGLGATASWVVTERANPVEVVAGESTTGELDYEFVAQGDAVVDLSTLALDDDSTITIEANLSEVHVILPAEPLRFTQNAELSEVEVVHPSTRVPDEDRPRSSATLVINAVMSTVVVEYQS